MHIKYKGRWLWTDSSGVDGWWCGRVVLVWMEICCVEGGCAGGNIEKPMKSTEMKGRKEQKTCANPQISIAKTRATAEKTIQKPRK